MQEYRCLLCGARLRPDEFIDACTELLDPELGVLGALCPYCQGSFEIMPMAGRLDLGYRSGSGFQVAQSIPYDGLVLERLSHPAGLVVTSPERSWQFFEED